MGNCLKSLSGDDDNLITETAGDENNGSSTLSLSTSASASPSSSTSLSFNSEFVVSPSSVSVRQQSHERQNQNQSRQRSYLPSRVIAQPVRESSDNDQIKIAKKVGLIHHLPLDTYDGKKKIKECVICMTEFTVGDIIRYLPCVHVYHKDCIDEWLMKSFTCPSCMEPVDSALLCTYKIS